MATGKIVSITSDCGLDTYNPSTAIKHNGFWYHGVREEPRSDEFNYRTRFFKEVTPDSWEIDTSIGTLPVQDPFVTTIYGKIVVGGVRVIQPGELLVTTFYVGDSLDTLKEFAQGPPNQKDIRLCETQDNKIAILTRPQGVIGNKGKIGFGIVSSLDFVNEKTISSIPILANQPNNNEWWGSNDVRLLPNGNIGVIGHIAKRDQNDLSYAAIAFTISPISKEVYGPKIIAMRSNFPTTSIKKAGLQNVVFPAGIREVEERTILYVGLSDAAIGVIDIPYPF